MQGAPPRTTSRDVGAKLADYFRVPSVRHYLIVRTDCRTVIRHRRRDGEEIATRIVAEGAVSLDPPAFASTRISFTAERARACARSSEAPSCARRRPPAMAKTLDQPSLHDTDYVLWLEEQVAHLRAGRLAALDVENVALELESLTSSERRELANRLEVLIHHLLKWDHQPEQRSNRWRATVEEQRSRIRRLLGDSPSLKLEVESTCHDVYVDAVRAAAIESRLEETAFPTALPYTVEQIFERRLPAGELPEQRTSRKKTR